MLLSRYLFIQENLKIDHTIQHNDGTTTIDFFKASAGQKLLKELRGIGITRQDIDVAYMYPKVPQVTKTTKGGKPISYKDVTLTEAKPYQEDIVNQIIETKPEVVIPNGRLGCKFFTGTVSITKTRGVPLQETVENEAGESHTFWVLPIFSMEYVEFKPAMQRFLDVDMDMLRKFHEQGEEVFLPSRVNYDFVTDFNKVEEIFEYLLNEKPLSAWDLETNTLKPEMEGAKALVISVSWREKSGYTIPIQHKEFNWTNEQVEKILKYIEEYVGDKESYKVGANLKFDLRFLKSAYGMTEFHNHMDVQVAYWMVISQDRSVSRRLGDITYEFTDMGGYDKELEDWIADYKKEYRKEHKEKPVNEIDGSDFNYEWIPLDMLASYAAGDVDATLRIHNALWEKVKTSEKWIELYTDFYPRLSAAAAQTESNGLSLDVDYADVVVKEYRREEQRILEAIRELPSVNLLEQEHRDYYEMGLAEWAKPKAERDEEIAKWRDKFKNKLEFNPNSSPDKGKVLFDILEVRFPFEQQYVKDGAWNKKNPKSNDDLSWEDYSASSNSLEEIITGDYSEEAKKLAGLMLEFSSVSKLRTSFAERAKSDMADDGNIHGNLNITGTATSRLSASNPNFQQLPSTHNDTTKFDYKYPIKRLYKSRYENGIIMNADYSALEMRVLGLVANDPDMTKTFLEDGDIHSNTASIINHKPEEDVTADERQASKAISFGIIYGKGIPGLATDLEVSEQEAQKVYDQFMASKPNVSQYIESVHNFVKEHGYVETLQGHRRNLQDIFGSKSAEASALRQSVNTIN